jgi:hypothetical protein
MENLKRQTDQIANELESSETENFQQWHNWLKNQDLKVWPLHFLRMKASKDSFGRLDFKNDAYDIPEETIKLIEKYADSHCWDIVIKKIIPMAGGFSTFIALVDHLMTGENKVALGIISGAGLFLLYSYYKYDLSDQQVYRIAQSLSEHEFKPEKVDIFHQSKLEIGQLSQDLNTLLGRQKPNN